MLFRVRVRFHPLYLAFFPYHHDQTTCSIIGFPLVDFLGTWALGCLVQAGREGGGMVWTAMLKAVQGH
jgi:hypothetical protein